ncbi:methyltransferase family protein [Kribbella endophytica]
MAVLALVLFGIYFGVAFVLRTALLVRRTGDHGFRGLSGRPGSARWWAGVLFALALLAGLAGPIAALAGLDPIGVLDSPAIATAGAAAAVAGIAATVITQYAMGTSWRIGVDAAETTTLVTTGPFALVRNPVFTAMAITGLGLTLITPNPIALAGAVTLLIALQLQVRVVEEPYLLTAHGTTYRQYAATTGRFVPGFGRLSS